MMSVIEEIIPKKCWPKTALAITASSMLNLTAPFFGQLFFMVMNREAAFQSAAAKKTITVHALATAMFFGAVPFTSVMLYFVKEKGGASQSSINLASLTLYFGLNIIALALSIKWLDDYHVVSSSEMGERTRNYFTGYTILLLCMLATAAALINLRRSERAMSAPALATHIDGLQVITIAPPVEIQAAPAHPNNAPDNTELENRSSSAHSALATAYGMPF